MSEADFYPAGAYRDPSAPYNQEDIPEKEFDVTCSQTLSKTTTVLTDNYIPGASGVDYESDDEGGCYASSWQDPDDTSETNWEEEYHDNDHYTPLQLIQMFGKYLQKELDSMEKVSYSASRIARRKELNHLINECKDWCEDETEYVE